MSADAAVTTLYAASAVATAAYYTRYLADAAGEEPGRWCGQQGVDRRVDDGDVPADDLRLDDPQIHTHAVISAKVQTVDSRWLALDGRYLKRQQRTLGGLYQSVLRAELTHRFGITWAVVNGQAEIAGIAPELFTDA